MSDQLNFSNNPTILNLHDTAYSAEEAISQIRHTVATSGWQLMVKVLTESMEEAERVLLDTDSVSSLEDYKLLKQKRTLLKELTELPAIIIDSLFRKDIPEPNLDPYQE